MGAGMIVHLSLTCSLIAMIAVAPANADEATYLAGTCMTCHRAGDQGSAIPNLAGRDVADLVAALQAYRTGARQDAIMHAVAASLSDAESIDVAAYFARQEPAQ
jgi:cytochrome subunit of sulfide dehydrogenase